MLRLFSEGNNKRNHVVDSEATLALFRRNPDKFLRRYITVDGTWIRHYTPQTKEKPKQWIFEGERAAKKAKTVKSAGKVMATVFWNARGIIYIDYLEKRQTITGAYHATILHRLSEEIKKKCPLLKKILFHQDNARVHTCAISMAKIMKLKKNIHRIWPPVTFFKFETWKNGSADNGSCRRGHRPNRCLFWGPSEILLFGRLKKVGETLGKAYRVKRILCCKIKNKLHRILCFSIFF